MRTVAGVLAKLTRVIVASQGLCSDGAFDGSARAMADGRGRGRRLRRSRGLVRVSRRCRVALRVDWR